MISPLDEYSTFEISIHPSSYPPLSSTSRPYEKKAIGEQNECENSASKSRLLYMAMSKFSIQELFSKLRKTPKNASSIVVKFDSKI